MASSEDEYYDLGPYNRPISTKSLAAQTWFSRGLIWSYAFNHEESAECFKLAIGQDDGCAMAYWGLAYALGPNYNKPWETFDDEDLLATIEETHRAVADAQKHAASATPVEQALIHALSSRYPAEPGSKDWSVWNSRYADAMGDVYRAFPADLDVAALYADALMNLTPWKLWDIRTGLPAPGARTLEIQPILETALAQPGGTRHPGLLHLYIHFIEMSPRPELGLRAADCLRELAPDAGHLRHMPSHLDVMCGDYRRGAAANEAAIRADEEFAARTSSTNFYTLYRLHNYHFRIYAAMFAGQSAVALETAGRLQNALPEKLLRVESPPMADWLEGFLGVHVHVLVRFGKWDELIALELPTDAKLYAVTTAMQHYGKGVALAATGRVDEAEGEKILFRDAVSRVPESRTLFNNKCLDILAVAAAMLDGELEYRRGNFEAAFEALRKSIELDGGLPYDEPWGWMQPTRHAYGALLLEQGHVEEAAKVYAADLGFDDTLPRAEQHPNNVWSLHGYHECLSRLGREAEARIIRAQLKLAEAVADVPVKSSCFCRL